MDGSTRQIWVKQDKGSLSTQYCLVFILLQLLTKFRWDRLIFSTLPQLLEPAAYKVSIFKSSFSFSLKEMGNFLNAFENKIHCINVFNIVQFVLTVL